MLLAGTPKKVKNAQYSKCQDMAGRSKGMIGNDPVVSIKGMEGKEVGLFKASMAFQLMTESKVVFLALEHHLSMRCAGQGSWLCGLLHLCGFSHFSFLQENCLPSSSAGLGFRVCTYGIPPTFNPNHKSADCSWCICGHRLEQRISTGERKVNTSPILLSFFYENRVLYKANRV